MSYRLKRKRFKCIQCKSVFNQLVQADTTTSHCENCGKTGFEENHKEEEELMPDRKRRQLHDGAYRIVFNNDNQSQFHNKTNLRDKSIDNLYGDVNFAQQTLYNQSQSQSQSTAASQQNSSQNQFNYRTPNIRKTAKLETQFTNNESANKNLPPRRPPSGRANFQNQSQTSGLPRIDSRQQDRQLPNPPQMQNQRPPSGQNANQQQRPFQQQQRPSQANLNNPTQSNNLHRNLNTNATSNSGYPNRRDYASGQNNQNGIDDNDIPPPLERVPRMSSQQPPRQNIHQQQQQQQQQHNQNSNNNQNNSAGAGSGPGGVRTRSTTYRIGDGIVHVVEVGHQNNGNNRQNVQFGSNVIPGMNFPESGSGQPQFFFMRHNNSDNEPQQNTFGMQMGGNGNMPHLDGIHQMINSMMRNFQDLFSSHEFLRMNTVFQGFSPDTFMSNFQGNFTSDDDFFERIRRMSEMEAEANAKKKKAKVDSVKKLPIVKIENKHCKKGAKGELEPPTCTVCCDQIAVGMKGMFMPCGHIYHQDCLMPWLNSNNTCPVCRYELPTEAS